MTPTLRILLVTSDLSGRGANFIRAWNLGRAMAETGHAVTLLAGPPSMTLRPRRTRFAGFDLLCGAALEPRRFRRSGWGPADLAGRWAALRRLDFDIVHVFGHRPAAWLPLEALPGRPDRLVAADWADWYGVGGIAEQRGRIGRLTVGRLDDWLERRMARWAAGMTVITRRLEAMALERGFGSTKVLRLTAGADTRSIVPLPKAEARARLGLDPERPVVMNCGLTRWDRVTVLQVFSEITLQDSRALLLLVGGQSKDAERSARLGGWQDRLVQLPHVAHDRLGPILAAADVVLLPLPNVGMNLGRFPNQAGDAMAAGRAIVTNPTGDLGDFVREMDAGVLADEKPVEMAQAVLALLRDQARVRELGEHGRRTAIERMAWPLLASRVLAWYQDLK